MKTPSSPPGTLKAVRRHRSPGSRPLARPPAKVRPVEGASGTATAAARASPAAVGGSLAGGVAMSAVASGSVGAQVASVPSAVAAAAAAVTAIKRAVYEPESLQDYAKLPVRRCGVLPHCFTVLAPLLTLLNDWCHHVHVLFVCICSVQGNCCQY